ncbi:hypothetical protein NL676_025978 [Syzygium grande]|nr:hypothetical protein NL676_025978 [Syzygium grande]
MVFIAASTIHNPPPPLPPSSSLGLIPAPASVPDRSRFPPAAVVSCVALKRREGKGGGGGSNGVRKLLAEIGSAFAFTLIGFEVAPRASLAPPPRPPAFVSGRNIKWNPNSLEPRLWVEMNISALLTSAGINIGLCVVLLLLYSLLRKQPSNLTVYFGRRLAQARPKRLDSLCFDRFVPSPSWIVKAWETSEEELLSLGGLDAVVFIRILVFSLRVFSIAAFFCMFLVLPVNYYGQEMHHKEIPYESLEVFTIGNVKEGSKWLWAHCLALYIISCSAWLLLYFEYKTIANMRVAHIKASATKPSHFTMLVRAIPWSPEESYSDSVDKFFSNYYLLTYMGHQMVYRSGYSSKTDE